MRKVFKQVKPLSTVKHKYGQQIKSAKDKSLNDQEFNDLVKDTRLSRASKEAARLVFVSGQSQMEAATEIGISKQRMNQIVNTVRGIVQERINQEPPELVDGRNMIAVLDASYAFAVKDAREKLGDEVRIEVPGEKAKTIGQVIARTNFHLVQSLGRNTVAIHDLAKLDRVPTVGRNVAIQYEAGKGVVLDREQNKQHTGHGR